MLNRKRTILIGFLLIAMVALALACPDNDTAPAAQGMENAWTDSVKNPKDPDSIYPYTKHADLSPAGVAYSGYDETRSNIILKELKQYEKQSSSDDAVFDAETALPLLVDSLLAETDQLNTQLSLLDIKYYNNANDEEIADETTELQEKYISLTDRCLQTLRNILRGPNGDILKAELSKDDLEALGEYEDMTKREKALYKEGNDLVQKYDKLILNSGHLKKDHAKFTGILSDLAGIRNELAQIYGYDDFSDYAYEEIYYRDYTCGDAQALHDDVKNYIVPLYVKCTEDFYGSEVIDIFFFDDPGDEILRNIAPYIGEINPQLKTSFNYLRRFHMYDINDAPTKMDVGYTTGLPAYGSPFIFNTPYREAADYSVTIHEFGHFNAEFHKRSHALFASEGSYDIAEIQSQGLELLFLDYYDELFGESADVVKSETLSNMLAGVVTGCMYDEFQQELFANPDMTGKEMDALAVRLAKEYGLIEAGYTTQKSAPYDWVNVSHTYESPMYYISYATSALSALDIWAEALDDRDAAIDSYMKISAVDPDKAYLEGLEACGLRNIFEDGSVKEIADRIEKAID